MRILKLLFCIISVNSRYISHKTIPTGFKQKSDVIDYLTQPKFYFKYLDIVDANNVKFNPKIKESDLEVKFPQEISYFSIPKIHFIPSKLTRIKVFQKWDKSGDIFSGHIKTKFIEFRISIQPVLEKHEYLLCFKGEIIQKSFIVPETYLDTILGDFGDIFLKITNTKC